MQTIRDANFYETAGFNAYRLGLNSFDAPYKPGTPALKSWLAGYKSAKDRAAKPLAVSDKNKPTSCATVAPSGAVRQNTRPNKAKPLHARPTDGVRMMKTAFGIYTSAMPPRGSH